MYSSVIFCGSYICSTGINPNVSICRTPKGLVMWVAMMQQLNPGIPLCIFDSNSPLNPIDYLQCDLVNLENDITENLPEPKADVTVYRFSSNPGQRFCGDGGWERMFKQAAYLDFEWTIHIDSDVYLNVSGKDLIAEAKMWPDIECFAPKDRSNEHLIEPSIIVLNVAGRKRLRSEFDWHSRDLITENYLENIFTDRFVNLGLYGDRIEGLDSKFIECNSKAESYITHSSNSQVFLYLKQRPQFGRRFISNLPSSIYGKCLCNNIEQTKELSKP